MSIQPIKYVLKYLSSGQIHD